MSLANLLSLSANDIQQEENPFDKEITEQRLRQCMPQLRELIAYYRAYPDIFVDEIKGPDCKFQFYFYQRVYLRVAMRHRFVYATFPRAFSKSFLSMMVLMLRAVLYPGQHAAITTGGKQQAASITISKIQEICKLIPSLANELNWQRGKTKTSKNDVHYIFKNGSAIDILAATQRSRGQRRNSLLMEQCVLIDGTILNEVIIPTTNVDRLLPDGQRDRQETPNKSQIYITTAGWKNSFAYQKLVETFVQSILDPDHYMIMGGTYQIPVREGLLDEDFVDQLKLQGTYNEDSFDRQYRSIWSGDAEDAFYSAEKFDRFRTLLLPEDAANGRNTKDSAYYVIGVDVGRFGCTTEALIFKVYTALGGVTTKSLVNLFTYEAEDFEDQAIALKKLYYRYNARVLAIDANGVGAGLIDFMTKTQSDPKTGQVLPPFGVEGGTNDDVLQKYKKAHGPEFEENAMYLIKASAPINTEAYVYAQTQLTNGKIRFLVDEQQARIRLMSTKKGQAMTTEQRNDFYRPYVLTTSLREQLLNLVQDNDGINIILKQNNKGIPKDKFSAFIYGLYYIKQEEESKRRRRSHKMSDFMFFS